MRSQGTLFLFEKFINIILSGDSFSTRAKSRTKRGLPSSTGGGGGGRRQQYRELLKILSTKYISEMVTGKFN